jgi:hypothetical protein
MQKFPRALIPPNGREAQPPGRHPNVRVKPPVPRLPRSLREKQHLKEIDTGKSSQGSIEKFFNKSGE